jgi:DNA polymerase III epsilon subunit-like protein
MSFPKVDLSRRFKRCCIVDVETGGFSREKNPLLEVGVLVVDHHLDVVDHFHTYVMPAPGLVVEPGAAEVNGYKPELWGIFPEGRAPTPEEEAAVYRPMCERGEVDFLLRKWFGGSDGTTVGSAYNAPFDRAWMAHYAPGFTGLLKPDWLCSLQAIKDVYKQRGIKIEKGMAKLGAVCDGFKYGEITGETWKRHTALDDCYAARFAMAVASTYGAFG